MNDQQPLHLSFGKIAEAYERGRPEYSAETAAWLLDGQDTDRPLEILELGAGTGKLTRALVALGHVVHATDPDEGMLDVLARTVPQARTAQASAESIPYPDRMFDVVVAAQSFHWFDAEQTLPEIARVLRPTGQVALVWHERDVKIPWVRRFGHVLGQGGSGHSGAGQDSAGQGGAVDAVEPLIASRHFGVVNDAAFKNWQHINAESVLDLALSRAAIASLPAEGRAQKLAEVKAFYDDFGRGMDGMELPYWARCFSAKVIERAQPVTPVEVEQSAAVTETAERQRIAEYVVNPMEDTAIRPRTPRTANATPPPAADEHAIFRSDGTDTDMLLIDFR